MTETEAEKYEWALLSQRADREMKADGPGEWKFVPAERPKLVGDEPPFALTDQHIKALELAIRAEGYEISVDPETGEVRLEKNGAAFRAAPGVN